MDDLAASGLNPILTQVRDEGIHVGLDDASPTLTVSGSASVHPASGDRVGIGRSTGAFPYSLAPDLSSYTMAAASFLSSMSSAGDSVTVSHSQGHGQEPLSLMTATASASTVGGAVPSVHEAPQGIKRRRSSSGEAVAVLPDAYVQLEFQRLELERQRLALDQERWREERASRLRWEEMFREQQQQDREDRRALREREQHMWRILSNLKELN
ncbi:hypothetical protein GGI15_004307 [Coemansia interrupta]|uniref:Uncharacterized protein n=1 Tax=Coemansia interrupta TaxID=1126814 RepID=A0A9W8LF81_9FUNG|nr:hypothetical protein GGI15_004307 [Coemansia interrupta]